MTDTHSDTGMPHGVVLELRAPGMDDPWEWLAAGWRDLWRNPLLSLGYGAVFVVTGLMLTAGLFQTGLESAIPAVAAGFTLVAPLLAIGLYEMSRRYEIGAKVRLWDLFSIRPPVPAQLAFFAFSLMFMFMVWLRLASLTYALFSFGDYLPASEFIRFSLTTPQGLMMLVVGTMIGGAVALFVFAISAISVPILMRHNVDVLTAMWLSMSTVLKHPGPMLLWAWLIGVLTLFALASLMIGLVIVFPLIGHATWHAYRTIVAGEIASGAR